MVRAFLAEIRLALVESFASRLRCMLKTRPVIFPADIAIDVSLSPFKFDTTTYDLTNDRAASFQFSHVVFLTAPKFGSVGSRNLLNESFTLLLAIVVNLSWRVFLEEISNRAIACSRNL